MWPITQVTKKLGIQYPIIQAPMAGGATTPELVAAVSNANCLGSFAAGFLSPDEMRQAIKLIRAKTKNPFAVNLFVPEEQHVACNQVNKMCQLLERIGADLNLKIEPLKPPYIPSFDDQMNIILEEKVPVFSFTFGIPDNSWISALKNKETILIGTATHLDEAIQLQKSGIDLIVAQGCEAGGHRGTFIGLAENALIGVNSLVPQLSDHIQIPVIAAGGIMDARGVLASLLLGAEGVQMGTAFLSCFETGIHPLYKKMLLSTTKDNTTLTRVFSGKLARGMKNKFIHSMEVYKEDLLPYPIQNALTRTMRKEAEKQNCIDFMSMWAGQASYMCKDYSAAELIAKIISDINSLLFD